MSNPINADEIARSLTDEVQRDALVALLNQRWDKTLTLMSAPGGYGKTRALAQAVRSNEEDPIGVEFYLRARPGFSDPARLGASILQALGASPEPHLLEHTLVERIVDEFASFSPTKVVLIIDDMHVLAAQPDSVALLVDVVRLLPTNSHIVLVGRKIPELPLARLQADDEVLEIDQSDLVFGDAEIDELVELHSVDRNLVTELAGWPALIRLAVVAGKAGPQEFLMQEIVDDLTPEVSRALMVAVLAGCADSDLLQRCDLDVSPAQLADLVPLLDLETNGDVRPHDLWSDLVAEMRGHGDLSDVVATVAEWHSDGGRYDEAIVLAVSHDAPELARSVLMDALGNTDVSLRAGMTAQWLELFGGADGINEDDADLLLLRGWHQRLAHGPGHGDDDVTRALAIFHERGDARGEAHASVENAFRGYLAGDVARIADAFERSPRLVEAGMEFLETLGEMTRAVVSDIQGDFPTALEHSLRAIAPGTREEFAELALRHRATLYFLVGDADNAVAATKELVDFVPSQFNRTTHLVAKFASGDIDELVERWPEIRYQETGNKRDDFIHATKSVFVDACLGIQPNLDTIRSVEWERPREQFQKALCEWCAALIGGREEDANATLQAEVARLGGLEDPMVKGDISRFIVSGYMALPEAREYFEQPETSQTFGPYQRQLLGLARLLHAGRTGAVADWSSYISPAHTISSMSLPWSVELACALVAHDETRGLELVDSLFVYAGSRPQAWLRTIAESSGPLASGASRLLSLLPAPPEEPTVVVTQGSVALRSCGETTQVSRVRVRQLLLLLVMRGSIRRDVAMTLLWPDKDIDKARNNLRITLTHLRDDLEPTRRSGEPSYHLRQRGEDIVLSRSEFLSADLWDMQDNLAAAASAADRSAELQLLLDVAECWEPPLLIDLVDLADVRPQVDALEARLVDATIEAAEACVSSGDYATAERLGRKLLVFDRYHERAYATIIACHLGAGRTTQAHQAIDECLAALADLSVQPTAATRMLLRRARYPEDPSRRTA